MLNKGKEEKHENSVASLCIWTFLNVMLLLKYQSLVSTSFLQPRYRFSTSLP